MCGCGGDSGARFCAAGVDRRQDGPEDSVGGDESRRRNRAAPRTGIAKRNGRPRNSAEGKQPDVHAKYRTITSMKKIFLPLFLLVAVLAMTAATSGPRVSRGTLASMEKSLDERIQRLWDDTPYLLLGTTRGVYLEGYGAVFTAEVNLVMNPVGLMSTRLTKDDIARVRQKKLDRIPILKKALRESMVSMA